jgi:hypothetical protein
MAKYLAGEYCKEVVEDSLRIHARGRAGWTASVR